MKYDFDSRYERRDTGSVKWDIKENELPMWVADMDFKAAPAVIEALEKRVEHGIFGYCVVPDSWSEAIQGWWSRRHGYKIEKEQLVFCSGVVPAIGSAIKRLTDEGDSILLQTPVYSTFFGSIENHGRQVLESELKYDGKVYSIDFKDLEEKLSRPPTKMMIICNPQNPIGQIWSREELLKIGELCDKYKVLLLSDEIHCDLCDPGCNYIPFASVSELCEQNSITFISVSKAFNLAGIQSAALVIADKELRHKMEQGLRADGLAHPNAFAVDATVAALNKSEEWLDELREYLRCNKLRTQNFLKEELSELKALPTEATYLLWIDCKEVTEDSVELCDFIREKTGLFLTNGSQYGGNGKHFIRMNVACPAEQLEDALSRLKKGVRAYAERAV